MRMAVYDKGIQIYERYWFLFNDQLVVAKRTSTGNRDNPSEYRLKHKIPLNELWLGSEVEDLIRAVCGSNSHLPVKIKDSKHKDMIEKLENQGFLVGWPSTNYIAIFKNKQDRDGWLNVLSKYLVNNYEEVYKPYDPGIVKNNNIINTFEENFTGKNCNSINLKLTTKDLHNRLRAKYVAVHNKTTAREVVNQALNEFQIYSNASEYSLLVGKGQGGGSIAQDDYRMIDKDKIIEKIERINETHIESSNSNINKNEFTGTSSDLSLLSGSNNAVATLIGK